MNERNGERCENADGGDHVDHDESIMRSDCEYIYIYIYIL